MLWFVLCCAVQVKQETVLDEEQMRHIWYQLEEFAIHDGDDIKRYCCQC